MNVEAALLTALLFVVFFGAALAFTTKLGWVTRNRSNIYRAVRKRNDPTDYRSDHDDE